jgi:hypothetical protein
VSFIHESTGLTLFLTLFRAEARRICDVNRDGGTQARTAACSGELLGIRE